jgi:hypothetical protein
VQRPPPPKPRAVRRQRARPPSPPSEEEEEEEEEEKKEEKEEKEEAKAEEEDEDTGVDGTDEEDVGRRALAPRAGRRVGGQSTDVVFIHLRTITDLKLHHAALTTIKGRGGNLSSDAEWKAELSKAYEVSHCFHF